MVLIIKYLMNVFINLFYIKYNLITESENDNYLYKQVYIIWNLFSKQIEESVLLNLSYEKSTAKVHPF